MKNYLKLCLVVAVTNAASIFVTYSLLQPSKEVVAEPPVEVLANTGKEYLICDGVCSGHDELVQYFWETCGILDLAYIITDESHRDRNAKGAFGEKGLLQWTSDTQSKRDFINSDAFKNPNRQVDRACEDYKRRIPYPKVIRFQIKGYDEVGKRAKYFRVEYK